MSRKRVIPVQCALWARLAAVATALALIAACSRKSPPPPDENVGKAAEALSAITIRTYGFESLSDWSPFGSSPTLSLSTTRLEGLRSLSVAGGGWSSVISRILVKEDPAPTTVGFDLRIPSPQPNPSWYGTVQLFVSIPSQGINNLPVGLHDLITWTPAQFKRAEFPLPANVQAALNANFNDLRWRIELNRPHNATAGYLFDRFTYGPLCTPVDDGNSCTVDSCNAQGQPIHTPVPAGTSCSDSNVCNGAETCNATGTCVAGTPPVLDDGNLCTTDACNPATGVTHTPVPAGTSCSDGNACNGAETCNASASCVAGTPVTCTASDQCHLAGTCNPATGVCSNPEKPNGTVCNDASACTQTDTCQAGSCTGANPVVCVASDQCHEPGICNPANGACSNPEKPNGATCTDGSACTQTDTCQAGACSGANPIVCVASDSCHDAGTCNPANGTCSNPSKPNGTSCNDATVCNGSETCQGGTCTAGTPPPTDDGNLCTADACDPIAGVTHTPVAAGTSCADSNACNGDETCNPSGSCVSGTPVVCVASSECHEAGTCNPATGACSNPAKPDGSSCADATVCNGNETCAAGECVSGTPPTTDDGNACTTDACGPESGVSHTPVSAGTSCSNSNACDGDEVCNATGTCVPGTPPDLDDQNPCTTDACDPAGGVSHEPLTGTGCDDSNACNGADFCSDGVCQHENTVDDGNPCTVDTCDPQTGEATFAPLPEGTTCGDACIGAGTCDAFGFCQVTTPGAGVEDDQNPCTDDTCDPATGATQHVPHAEGTSCEFDSNQCNGEDTCNGQGECVAGTPPPLDDGNPCTIDECVFVGSIGAHLISHAPAPAGTLCGDDDTDPCNGVFACDNDAHCNVSRGTDDGNSCTADSCDPVGGIVNQVLPDGTACSDGSACTGSDTCGGGLCHSGETVDVDGNPCTTDICEPDGSVVHIPVGFASCDDDGDVCNGFGFCDEFAACVPAPPLPVDDGNPCTTDSCDPVFGALHNAVPEGTVCASATVCASERVCDPFGQCQPAGTVVDVNDGNPCTTDACDPVLGVTHEPSPLGTSCDADANPCTGIDACSGSGTCVPGAPPSLDDGNPCTTDACHPVAGVTHTPRAAGTSCSNGDACDGSEICSAVGVCNPGTPPPLDDSNPCTMDSCDPLAGVENAPLPPGTVCGDSLFCDSLSSCVALPPDPSAVAPPNASAVATTIFDSTKFLYSGTNPIQRGVVDGTITAPRAAVLRGVVTTREGAPLPRVAVSVKDHPELGGTLTREDGRYDMAVNGGESLTLDFETVGRLRAQRTVHVPWQNYVNVDAVALVELDPIVTAIDFSADGNVALGSEQTDEDGPRRATLIFQSGTQATMILPDGSEEPLETMSVRLTEYTVGPNGREAMPAQLPPTSAYTYAVELSADEAIAAGAVGVEFDRPAALYVDNFLDAPVGTSVPAGFYDYSAAAWVGSEDGRCIKVLDIENGLAAVDVDGMGNPADAERLTELGISNAELEELANLFPPGRTLWRTPTTHFSTLDCNHNFMLPSDAEAPYQDENVDIEEQSDADEDPCTEPGCVISVATGGLSESVPLAGTPYSLTYASRITRGYQARAGFVLQVTGGSVPASLVEVEVDATIAGVREFAILPPLPNQKYALQWDGRDAYGRPVVGGAPANITIRYVYPAYYTVPFNDLATVEDLVSWARATGTTLISAGGPLFVRGQTVGRWNTSWNTTVGSLDSWQPWTWDARGAGLGGWRLDVHHTYDPTTNAVVLGTGKVRKDVQAFGPIMYTVAGNGPDRCCSSQGCPDDGAPAQLVGLGRAADVLSMPDGSFLIMGEVCNMSVLRRVRTDGTIRTVRVIGYGVNLNNVIADLVGGQRGVTVERLALGPNNTVYFTEGRSVLRLDFVDSEQAVATKVAGSITAAESDVEGIPAVDAYINWSPVGVAVASDGTTFVSDRHMVRAVGPDGIIRRVAGKGGPLSLESGDDGPALEADVIVDALALGADGSLYLGSWRRGQSSPPPRVRRVTPDGIIRNFAGGGNGADGTPAISAFLHSDVRDIALSSGGSLYLALQGGFLFGNASLGNGLVRLVEPSGAIQSIAGRAQVDGPPPGADGSPARDQRIVTQALENAPDGTQLVLTAGPSIPSRFQVRRIAPALPGVGDAGFRIASEGGSEVYVFDRQGKHLETRDTVTGAQLYAFSYDSAGELISVDDRAGNRTNIERDASGQPLRIVGPFGQATELTLDANGYLSKIDEPESGSADLNHDANGLLRTFTDGRGGTRSYDYDEKGRLTFETGPDAASQTFQLTETREPEGDVRSVARTTGGGMATNYRWTRSPNGAKSREITTGDLTELSEMPLSGSSRTTSADGTVVSRSFAPDPRFGMAGFYESGRTETTPAGLSRTTAVGRQFVPETGVLQETLTRNGASWVTLFDPSTRSYTETSPEGRASQRVLDPAGRTTRIQVGSVLPLDLSYDAQGRLEQIVQGGRVAAYSYTASGESAGYLETVTKPDAISISYTRDALGRALTESIGGQMASFAWDPNGNLTTVVPPERPAHGIGYTSSDLLSSYTPPEIGLPLTLTSYDYDLDRNLTSETRPNGQVITRTYDALGRLDTASFSGGLLDYGYHPAGTNGAGQVKDILGPYGVDLHLAYDGHLNTIVSWTGDVVGGINVSFRDDFLVETERVSGASGPLLTTSFAYDLDQLLTCASPTTCSPAGADALLLSRHPQNGLVTNIALGSTSEAWTYNVFGEAARQMASFGGSPIVDIIYDDAGFERDTLGRVVRKTETIVGVTKVYDYRYDTLSRLDQVKVDGVVDEEFTYDANGNRLTAFKQGVEIATAMYDDQDRLLASGDWVFTYTANGDLETKTNTATGDEWAFQYDALGNLVSVGLPNGDFVEYLVDGLGRRVGKKKNGALLQQWIYRDALKPAAELDGSGNVVSQFVYGSKPHVPDYIVRGGSTYRIISDHLGSPRYAVNIANAADVPFTATYLAFGAVTGTGLDWMPFGFAGGINDRDSGLVRFGARDYDPMLGRWTSKDPIRFDGGINLYAYVENDPVNLIDPWGFVGCDDGKCFSNCMDAQGVNWLLGVLGLSTPFVSIPKVGRDAAVASRMGASGFTSPASMLARGLKAAGATGAGNTLRAIGARLNPYANLALVGASTYIATSAALCGLECAGR